MEQHTASSPRPIKVPGPDHPITIARNPNRVVVSVAGRIVADTRNALTLRGGTLWANSIHSAQGRGHGAADTHGSCDILPL